MKKAILFTLVLGITTFFINAQTLTIKVEGVKGKSGKILLAFFTSEDKYEIEKPSYTKTIRMAQLKNGNAVVSYDDIKSGTYGVTLLHDENNDGKMSYSFFVPTEGFGFSNFYLKGAKKPKFSDFSFEFGAVDKTITIKTKYL